MVSRRRGNGGNGVIHVLPAKRRIHRAPAERGCVPAGPTGRCRPPPVERFATADERARDALDDETLYDALRDGLELMWQRTVQAVPPD